MKKILFVVIGILAVVLVLSISKDMLVRVSVEKGMELVTGLELRVSNFRVGLINTLVKIKNLRLYNPKGYKDRIMLDMPEIYIDYDLPAIFKGKIHLEEMRINMNEFVVVNNEKGQLNLDALKVVQAQKQGRKPKAAEKGKVPEIQIDTLNLKIGKVIYKDYSKGGSPSVREFNVNLDEQYRNITDPHALVSIIVVKALMNTTIAGLADFDLKGLQNTVSNTLVSAGRVATETVEKTTEVVKGTSETLKKTTEELTEVFKAPFGSKGK
ncbi:MAG: hypothetical protein J7M30_05030 [Deltaproteobacteria bacterium]|nr:hypothetical protein [Deltaproteobacteria bacterium]